jgi:hypothetical protein
MKKLKAGIVGRVFRDGNRFAMLRDPSRNALSDAEFQAVDHIRMRVLGSAKDELIAFEYVDEAGVALDQRRSKFDYAGENVVKAVGSTEANTDFVQYIYV